MFSLVPFSLFHHHVPGLGWWFSADKPDYFKSTQISDYVKGFDESLREVEKIFEEKGPFDGILGFSQGGSMVGLICALKQLGGKCSPFLSHRSWNSFIVFDRPLVFIYLDNFSFVFVFYFY